MPRDLAVCRPIFTEPGGTVREAIITLYPYIGGAIAIVGEDRRERVVSLTICSQSNIDFHIARPPSPVCISVSWHQTSYVAVPVREMIRFWRPGRQFSRQVFHPLHLHCPSQYNNL